MPVVIGDVEVLPAAPEPAPAGSAPAAAPAPPPPDAQALQLVLQELHEQALRHWSH